MKTCISNPTWEIIYYYEWKNGWSILNSNQLEYALKYAKESKKDDVKWLEKELYKRGINGGEYEHWTY